MLKQLVCVFVLVASLTHAAPTPDFAAFDARARKGETLSVVFFGASLTWGANATDQDTTSYRAVVAERMTEHYPQAHFRFYDAAIGGTGSQLGVFRLERDVLRRRPDLVFLDFSANDDIYSGDPETSASYESLVRRLVTEAKVPVVQVLFPFKWNVTGGSTGGMQRRDAHLAIAKAYNTAVGDAIDLAIQRLKAGQVTADQLWPTDGVHPGDMGYRLFADAAFDAFLGGVQRQSVCQAPVKMLFADTYTHQARVRLASLFPQGDWPAGWRAGHPNLTAAFHDAQMSRWLDEVAIASNRQKNQGAEGKNASTPITPARLKLRFSGSMVLLFGEETLSSGRYHVYIDGQLATHKDGQTQSELFDASAKRFGGNRHHTQLVATGLDPAKEHTLEIEPLLAGTDEQELRLESICVAGGTATVKRAE